MGARRGVARTAAFLLLLAGGCASAAPIVTPLTPPDAGAFRLYHGDGREAAWEDLLRAAAEARVVLLGEAHQDTVGHRLRHRLVAELVELHGDQRPLVISLEMFERDVQLVLDEYLGGTVTEEHFLRAARPWPQYERDYRFYVEIARERGFPVVAANPPRRYVNLVARRGLEALDELPDGAFRWLPPLPVDPPSDRYRQEWDRAMGEAADHGGDRMLMAQNLWDAGMAHAIHEALEANPEAVVVHVAGSFHVAGGTGIPEHLARYRPGTESLIVVAIPEDTALFDPDRHEGRGDFVLLTTSGT